MSKQFSGKLLMVVAMVALSYGTAIAQLFYPYPVHNEDFEQAVDLYTKEMYRSALTKLNAADQAGSTDRTLLHNDIAFYTAMCALHAGQTNAESLIKGVLEASPRSHRYPEAAFGYAKYLYSKSDYTGAAQWFKQLKPDDLSSSEKSEYYFKSGYSYYRAGDTETAVDYFRKIKDQTNPYADAALYYYSHIEYERGNLNTAMDGFERLRDNPNYQSIIPYYTLQIAFIQKDYDRVIKEGEDFLEYTDESRKDEINRIVAEAYLYKLNASKSLYYFKEFEKNVKKLSREDLFLKATIEYLNKNYTSAADNFTAAAASINDSLAQHSHYYAGDSHIQDNNKTSALTSFMQASKMDFNKGITENALFNYAKLTLELNNNELPVNEYLRKYPNGRNNSELSVFLAASTAKKGKYNEALDILQSISDPSPEELDAVQRISFVAGQAAMDSENYPQAIRLFNLSKQSAQYPNSVSALASYWKAEATYKTGDYEGAAILYENFLRSSGSFGNTREFKIAHYNIAYTYFKERQYDEALIWFRKYNNFEENSSRKSIYLCDSYNRIGDCYFKKREFQQALENYNKSEGLSLSNPDYSAFQRALSLGFIESNDAKITNLLRIPKVYPKSSYLPAVYYELGRAYQQEDKNNDALIAFQTVTGEYRSSAYYPKALLSLGLLEINKGNTDKALMYYQRVVEKTPGTPEAVSAMDGIKNIYVDQNRMDEYFAYVSRVGQTVKSNDERDSLMFTAAERQYQSGNCDQTLTAVRRYISEFPTGVNLTAANFYMADCSMKKNDFAGAASAYEYVIKRNHNDFTESAWSGFARANYNLKNYSKAANAFEQLLNMAQTSAARIDAETGRMRSYAAMNDFERAAVPAARIVASRGISVELINEANLIRGKSLQQVGRYTEAIEVMRSLVVDMKKPADAEAKYRIIHCLYMMNKLKEAEDEVYEFSDSKSGQLYWMAKSFITLGDIYAKRKDYTQARATYKSIVDGYKNKNDGIVNEANSRLEEIQNN